jgi:hypothetical protein
MKIWMNGGMSELCMNTLGDNSWMESKWLEKIKEGKLMKNNHNT